VRASTTGGFNAQFGCEQRADFHGPGDPCVPLLAGQFEPDLTGPLDLDQLAGVLSQVEQLAGSEGVFLDALRVDLRGVEPAINVT
jgi:hypothetical protein